MRVLAFIYYLIHWMIKKYNILKISNIKTSFKVKLSKKFKKIIKSLSDKEHLERYDYAWIFYRMNNYKFNQQFCK